MTTRRSDRCQRALALAGSGHGALLLSRLEDVRWCSGFTGSNGWLVITEDTVTLLTDGRYVDQARSEMPDEFAILECRSVESMAEAVGRVAAHGPVAIQENEMAVATWRRLGVTIGERLSCAASDLADLRRTKEPDEIETIRRAARIADEALRTCIGLLRPGSSERSVRDALESTMRALGADGPSYDTIVASGPSNSARPHHSPGDRVFRPGDSVVIDVGALVDGYHSDMTRTYFIDEPESEMSRWYETLRRAQERAVSLVTPGRAVRDIDSSCREILADAGLAQWFTHGLGHGVGLMIHENPFINGTSEAILRPGDVVTIEPGLYRGGFGGMRIEDLILVTETSHENLTSSPKDPTCPR